MKAVIFAGGVGTRLWPLSRKKSPKQFEKVVGDKSTIQTSVEMLYPELTPKDIYIATGAQYLELVKKQVPDIPEGNVIGEPSRQDVGPAVAFWMGYLAKQFPNEPVVIVWSDHIFRNRARFKEVLKSVEALLREDPEKIIYLGHKPRFASENLGWIQTGKVEKTVQGVDFREFLSFKYRPKREVAEQYFANSKYCWNLGSFVSTPAFIYKLFERFAPRIYKLTESILASVGTDHFQQDFAKYYTQMPQISLDNAISEQLDAEFAYVVIDDFGWSDVGAWEALKEALEQNKEDNITHGKVLLEDSIDTLGYNYEGGKLIVGIDLENMLVVNTPDVLLVTKKTSVPKVKKLVESFEGTEYEELT